MPTPQILTDEQKALREIAADPEKAKRFFQLLAVRYINNRIIAVVWFVIGVICGLSLAVLL